MKLYILNVSSLSNARLNGFTCKISEHEQPQCNDQAHDGGTADHGRGRRSNATRRRWRRSPAAGPRRSRDTDPSQHHSDARAALPPHHFTALLRWISASRGHALKYG